MEIAIVILNWNGKNWLEKFLPMVVEFSTNASIYVIDNQSTDDSVSFIKQTYPTVKIINNKANYGYAKGYNEGLKEVNEEIYCLLNSDVEVTENWLNPILQLFKKDDSICAIQPKILDQKNKKYFEYAGAAGGFIDILGYPYCRGRMFFDIEEDKGQYDDEIEIFWATGACLFIRNKDFWEVNGFDEDYFAHMEEIDMCWRLKNLHKKIYYCGFSTIYHVGGGTLSKYNSDKTFYNFRNSIYTLLKNLPAYQFIPIILARQILDAFAAILFLFKNGFQHFWAVFRSHIAFYLNFYSMYKKRKPGIKNYYNDSFIVIKHFINILLPKQKKQKS